MPMPARGSTGPCSCRWRARTVGVVPGAATTRGTSGKRAAASRRASAAVPMPGAMAAPRKSPDLPIAEKAMAASKSTITQGAADEFPGRRRGADEVGADLGGDVGPYLDASPHAGAHDRAGQAEGGADSPAELAAEGGRDAGHPARRRRLRARAGLDRRRLRRRRAYSSALRPETAPRRRRESQRPFPGRPPSALS